MAILRDIEQGVYSWVAAEAAGVRRGAFRRGLRSGRAGEPGWAEFEVQVRTAMARTRATAEKRVYVLSPLAWLRYGLGREQAGRPGWTEKGDQATPGGKPGNGPPIELIEVHDSGPV